jgi:hypothetical protein
MTYGKVKVQLHVFLTSALYRDEWPLHPGGKDTRYPLDRRLGGPQSRSGRGGEVKNSHPLPGLEPPIIQPVAQRYTTELTLLQNVHNVVTGPTICIPECEETAYHSEYRTAMLEAVLNFKHKRTWTAANFGAIKPPGVEHASHINQ